MDKEKIHAFAVKWLMKLYGPDSFPSFARDFQFEEDCEALGFLQDGGALFREAYPECSEQWDTSDFVEQVDDVELLGSGIYSKWYGLDHWADTFKPEQCQSLVWDFKNGLAHLARLTRQTTPIIGMKGRPIESMELEIRQKMGKIYVSVRRLWTPLMGYAGFPWRSGDMENIGMTRIRKKNIKTVIASHLPVIRH